MDKVKVALSLPADVVQNLDEYACALGKKRTEVIYEAIYEYLGYLFETED